MSSHDLALLCFVSFLLAAQGGRNNGGYGRRHNDDRNGGGCGGYGRPPPPIDECKPPCQRSYGLPGQLECTCPDPTTAIPSTCPACEVCTAPATIECTTPTTESTTPTIESTTSTAESTTSTVESTTLTVESTTPKCECENPCRNGYVEFEGRCWRLTHTGNVRATEYLSDCTSDNSSLASIQNQAQNDFVRRLASTGLNMTYNTNSRTWFPPIGWNHVRIGAIQTADGWKWFDRKPFGYANWVNATVVHPTPPTPPTPDISTSAILPDLVIEPTKTLAYGTWRAISRNLPVRKGVCVYDLMS